jgi:type II secretory pathway pseudopilin PulG
MLIIGIVISIVIPALGGARNAARRAATQQVLTSFVQAASQFRNDNSDRQPGFFTPTEMGLAENIDYGLSAMENAMLDLMGGLVDGPGDPTEVIDVTLNDRTAYVNPGLVGKGAYFQPDGSYYKPMVDMQQVGDGNHLGLTEDDLQLLDVVDAWGNPLLLWTEDFYGPSDIKDVEDFARVDAGTGAADERAKFYWAPNACFLRSKLLGKSGKDQTNGFNGSLIGAEENTDMPSLSVSDNMMAMLGNPNYPNDRSETAVNIFATAARGAFVIQSAGTDAVFLGKRDNGTARFGLRTGPNSYEPLLYGFNFKVGIGNQDLTEDGQIVTTDVMSYYDDMLQSGGN